MINHIKFDDFVKDRQDWVNLSKKQKFDFDSILIGTYSDPSHFVYEILQNAEDSGAKNIYFNLFEDRLEIIHDGKDFDFEDVDGITGIGISKKRGDINSIGEFGAGFKSVYAISQSPEIKSGSYYFRIYDFVIPKTLKGNGIFCKTSITLPFNHKIRSKNEIYNLVKKKLENIGLKTLLFLSNIDEIKWKSLTKSGHYYKSSKNLNVANTKNITITSEIDANKFSEEYLVIQKSFEIDNKKLKVEVAYKITTVDKKHKKIIPVSHQESKLVVYFPTEKITYLNFIIQGPYKTTQNRENIPLFDDQNQIIIEETANLVANSLHIVKELGFLNTDFLEILPINEEYYDKTKEDKDKHIYSKIFEKVRDKFLSGEKLLPTIRGGFSNTDNSIIVGNKDLPKLLNQKDLKLLFGKSHWLDTNIRKEFKEYLLNELGIKEIDFEDFAESITEAFLRKKTDKWIIQFYRKLIDIDHQSLWKKRNYSWEKTGVLRRKPIIRLKENKHIPPFDSSDNIQVYLPTKTKSNYNTIKLSILKNRTALKFLKELGVSEPDIFAEINESVIPKYSNERILLDNDEYFEDFGKLIYAFNNGTSEKKNDLIAKLLDLFIVKALNPFTGEEKFFRSNNVYLKNDELNEYFKGYKSVFFIIDKLFNKFKGNKIREFLMEIGCNNIPKRIEISTDLSWEEKRKLRGNVNGYSVYTKDFDYEGLENFLLNINLDKSILLYKFLLLSLSKFDGWNKSEFFKGEYCWAPRSRKHYEKFDSKFLKLLKQKIWLYDKDVNPVNTELISISELADGYPKEDENINFLIEALGLKPDEIKRIEEKTGGKFITKEEHQEYVELKKWKAEQSLLKEKEESEKEDEWTPEVEPEDIKITIVEEFEPDIITTPDYRGQEPQKSKTKEATETTESDDIIEQRSTKKLKNIGKWGERFVFMQLNLNEKFEKENGIEIKWLNKNGDIGKGYDFLIISNGIDAEYIEVKSKIDEEPHYFLISGTQWEFARKLYNENEGNKYKIYIVSSAGSENANIKIITNPYELWKDGKLHANPINLKL